MTSPTNKIALVTGASRGIGRAIAEQLAQDGLTVAVHYHAAASEAQALVDQITSAGGTAFTLKADLSDRNGAQALADGFIRALAQRAASPEFDVLVNNAGISMRATIENVSEGDFDRIFQVNLRSPFFLIKALLPHLREGGRIINISSMASRAAFPDLAAYAPAKAGLEALTKLLAVQLGRRKITVNSVLPGATATEMNAAARDPVASRAVIETIALRRIGQPDDIAKVVAFLASDAGGWITGQQIDASGGQRL